jgi:hypothetical protein
MFIRDERKNAEHYSDPTAYEAIKRVSINDGTEIDDYIIARRQKMFPPGTKIRIIEMYEKSNEKHNGKIGYVDFVDDLGYIFIKFKGTKKGIQLSGFDQFEKLC